MIITWTDTFQVKQWKSYGKSGEMKKNLDTCSANSKLSLRAKKSVFGERFCSKFDAKIKLMHENYALLR